MAAAVVVPPLGPVIGPSDELYLTFQECPHDALPAGYKDGDDSIHADSDHHLAFEQARATPLPSDHSLELAVALEAVPAKRKVIVPHPRDLKRNATGPDVLALERAIAAAHYRKWGNFTQSFGAGVLAEIKLFQHDHGLPASGVYGEATHRKLAPFYDAYGISLLNGYAARSAVQKAQKRMLSGLMVAYNFRAELHYTQGGSRWYLIANHVRHEAIPSLHAGYGDCSSFATWGYWDVGAPDPNQLDFTGGFTGTLGAHGIVVSNPSVAQIGALFLYGPGTHEHVQIGVGGTDTIGFGSEIGPLYLPADYRGDLNVVRKYPGLSL